MWKKIPSTMKIKLASITDPGRHRRERMWRLFTLNTKHTGIVEYIRKGTNDQPWNLQKNVGEATVLMASTELQYSFVLPRRPMTSNVAACNRGHYWINLTCVYKHSILFFSQNMNCPIPKCSKKIVGTVNLRIGKDQQLSKTTLRVHLQNLSSDKKDQNKQPCQEVPHNSTSYSHNVCSSSKGVLWPLIPVVAARETGKVPLEEVFFATKVGNVQSWEKFSAAHCWRFYKRPKIFLFPINVLYYFR